MVRALENTRKEFDKNPTKAAVVFRVQKERERVIVLLCHVRQLHFIQPASSEKKA